MIDCFCVRGTLDEPIILIPNFIFRLLWDDLLSGQEFHGPYESVKSMCTDSLLMLCMLFARLDDSEYLNEARACNRTYYPVIPDETSDNTEEDYSECRKKFSDHCR